MRRLPIIITGAAAGALALAACSGGSGVSNGQALEMQAQGRVEQAMNINQPVPVFQHSDIRATAISIEAIQALGEQTTSFGFNMGERNPVWSCPSLGEPIASTTQITNPYQPDFQTIGSNGAAGVALGNMDPNGIYSGNSTGTYVLCVGKTGQPYAQYWEGFVDTVSGPAAWDQATGQIVVTGAPTMPTCTISKPGTTAAKTTCVK